MGGVMSGKCRAGRRMLRGTSLLEAVVASAVFLTIFTLTISILPQLIVHEDDASLVVEAEYRVEEAFGRYETGVWPCGEYVERYEWGEVTVRVERHRDFSDVRHVSVTARIEGNRKRIVRERVMEWTE